MTGKGAFYLQLCRQKAQLTQEYAAECLNISRRQLCRYESNESPVTQDILLKMTELYKAPFIVPWYIKYWTLYGEYLPDLVEMETDGDMGFNLHIALRYLSDAVTDLESSKCTGRPTDRQFVETLKRATDTLYSALTYVCQKQSA